MAAFRAANRGRAGVPAARRPAGRPRSAALLAAALLACAGGDEAGRPAGAASADARSVAAPVAERLASEAPPPEGALVVRLAFGAEADLDLYVTDPQLETVYFGHVEARSGGRLQADRRCGSPAPRVEEVRFEHPLPGRYRVGVDHPERCGEGEGPVPFAVSVAGPGVARSAEGALPARTFEPVVLEFELEGGG